MGWLTDWAINGDSWAAQVTTDKRIRQKNCRTRIVKTMDARDLLMGSQVSKKDGGPAV